jgi:hypothetical protein
MDGAAAKRLEKSLADAADIDRTIRLKERLERLLREAAEVQVELSRADGTIKGIPHYSVIETQGHELGRQLSREFQQRQMNGSRNGDAASIDTRVMRKRGRS